MTSAKVETVAQASAGANAARPRTGDDDIIANVLCQIEETRAEPEVQNIFAPDVDEDGAGLHAAEALGVEQPFAVRGMGNGRYHEVRFGQQARQGGGIAV